jgi:hypothetical protein
MQNVDSVIGAMLAIIAFSRKHHNTVGILAVNLLLGWTCIGWIVALVWAVSNPSPSTVVYVPYQEGK